MAGTITVSPYIGIRQTELIITSVSQAEREMAGYDDDAVVGLRRSLELIEALAHHICNYNEVIIYKYESYILESTFQYRKRFPMLHNK